MKGSGYDQDVCTPRYIARVVHAVLSGPPDLDPFGSLRSVVGALRQYILAHGEDGTTFRWYGKVYTNPPFESPTLGQAIQLASEHDDEVIMLVPLRTHRRYWSPAWTAQAICYLEPVTFEGETHTFPMPCVLLYWGHRAERFARNARTLGIVRYLTPYELRHRIPDKMTANVYEELQKRQADAVLDVVRQYPELSMIEIIQALSLEEGDAEYDRIMRTPLQELVVHTRPAKSNGANGHARPAAKRKPKGKRKAPKAANTAGGTDRIEKKLDAFFAKKSKGEKVLTSELMELTGLGRPATIKRLEGRPLVKRGAGRGAYFEVTA